MSQNDAVMGVLTYMSRDQILARLCSGPRPKLFNLKPMWGEKDKTTPRTMYVTSDVLAAVAFPFPDTLEGDRLGKFRGLLDDFVGGSRISVSEDPDDKPWSTMLARVHEVKDEFWSAESDALRTGFRRKPDSVPMIADSR